MELVAKTNSVSRLLLKYAFTRISLFKIRNSVIALPLADIVLIAVSDSRLSGSAK